MARNIIEYIKQKIKEYDSTIDTRDTAAIIDLMVNPLSTILGPYDQEHQGLLNQISLLDPTTLSEAEMDQIVANFLISRDQGAKSRGNVRIYFDEPQDFSIPAGTLFETKTNLQFYSLNTYAITSTQMMGNAQRYPLYSTDDILVEAAREGIEYDINPGAITKMPEISSNAVNITNLTGFSGGGQKETNTELYNKLLSSVTNETIASPDGITKLLKRNYPSINIVVVKGMTDDEMIRDLSFNAINSGLLNWNSAQYFESDIYGCVSGYHEYPYNQSEAFYGLFQDDPATSGFAPGDLPDRTEFTSEFTQNMYANIFRKDDTLYTEIEAEIVLDETFNAIPAGRKFQEGWFRSDTSLGLDNMVSNKEIEIDANEGAVRLGYRYDDTDIIDQPVLLPSIRTVEHIINLLRQAHEAGQRSQSM